MIQRLNPKIHTDKHPTEVETSFGKMKDRASTKEVHLLGQEEKGIMSTLLR
jgi:hypothetical protein